MFGSWAFLLWSLLSSPLLIGCDLTRLDPFTKALLTDDVLDLNQDPLADPPGAYRLDTTVSAYGTVLIRVGQPGNTD